jgi:hypothetical protein
MLEYETVREIVGLKCVRFYLPPLPHPDPLPD